MAILSAQPLLQQYVYRVLSNQYNISQSLNGTKECTSGGEKTIDHDPAFEEMEKQAALWNIIIVLGNLGPSVVMTVILGSYSDQAGRKTMIVPPVAGSLVSGILLFAFVLWELPLYCIIIIVLISGLSGGMGTLNLGCFAYMCDISTKSQRFRKMLTVELCTGLGTFAAQISTGYLIEYTGFLYPVIIQGVFLVPLLVYSVFFLQETVVKQASEKYITCTNWSNMVSLYFKDNGTGRRLILQLTFLLLFFIVFLDQGIYNILTFYFLAPPFCWGADLIGVFIGSVFTIKSLGGLVLTALLFGRLQETTLILIGCFSYVSFFLLLGFSQSAPLAFTGAACGLAAYLALPMIRAIASKHVQGHELGALFAGLTSAQILCTVLGTMALNPLYAWSAARWHGLVCIVAAAGMVIPISLNLVLKFRMSRSGAENPQTEVLIID